MKLTTYIIEYRTKGSNHFTQQICHGKTDLFTCLKMMLNDGGVEFKITKDEPEDNLDDDDWGF